MSIDAPLPVFLSCGTPYTAQQEEFIAAVEAHLKSHRCLPQTVGRSNYSVRQPAQAIRDLIGECRGAIVIAFERTRIIEAVERPDSPQEITLGSESHPTIWNQMEAAMAYSRRLPILTFVQSGLKRQGMLSNRIEWAAVEQDLTPALLRTTQFQQTFEEWLQLVKAEKPNASLPRSDLTEITIGALLSNLKGLKAKQAWGILIVIASLLGGVTTTAFKLGQQFPTEGHTAQSPSSAGQKAAN